MINQASRILAPVLTPSNNESMIVHLKVTCKHLLQNKFEQLVVYARFAINKNIEEKRIYFPLSRPCNIIPGYNVNRIKPSSNYMCPFTWNPFFHFQTGRTFICRYFSLCTTNFHFFFSFFFYFIRLKFIRKSFHFCSVGSV